MEREITDRTFDKVDFKREPLVKGTYDNCVFINCDLSDMNFSGFIFLDCQFKGCNLSMVLLGKTVFRDIVFLECKMTGLRFDQCSDFGLAFSFSQCVLNYCSFFGTRIKKTKFQQSALKEVDFTDCDLSGSTFDKCDLLGSKFENTNLEKADLRTAINYTIDPEVNKIKKARFSIPDVIGLLAKYDIEIGR